jgi:polyhydroxybutyrate depolymerase
VNFTISAFIPQNVVASIWQIVKSLQSFRISCYAGLGRIFSMKHRFLLALLFIGLSLNLGISAQENPISFEERSINVEGRERSFLLYVPSSSDSAGAIPLVFMLHGGGGNPDIYEGITGFGEKAREEGFILVYPAGTGRLKRLLAWNAGHCCAYAMEQNVDDVAFFRAMVAELSDEFGLDPNRIYAAGHSNGAMMAYRLAAEASDIFAAVGIVAGTIGGYPSLDNEELILIPEAENPVSILHIHGMADENVPYYGGESNGVLSEPRIDVSVAESIGFWLEINQCETEALSQTSADAMVLTEIYDCSATGTSVELISIVDGGHAWAGGESASRLSDTPSERVSATDEIWSFFAAHPRPGS